MKIGFDIMGGDYAPAETIKGACQFLQEVTDPAVHLVLIGDAKAASPYLSLLEPYQYRYTFVEAAEVIGMHEHPTKALKEKPDSSIAIGYGMLQSGKIDAFIGAGNTGAMMVGAMYTVKTIEGILRPAIISPIPRLNGKFSLMLDAGANADCKPENMVQFAQLGSLYAQHILGIENPGVGLLNLGEEEGKGDLLTLATYPLLKEDPSINFIGNIEGRDVFLGKADVIVCEGFAGNVALKMAESVYHIFKELRGVKDELLETFNYEVYGGSPIIGINSPVIIGHGISSALAFKNMIDVARRIVAADLMTALKEYFSKQVV